MDRMWAHDAPLSESMWVPQDSLTVTGSSTEISLSSEFPSPSSAPDSYPTINNNGILSVTGTSRPLFCATDRNTGLRFLVDPSPEVSAFPPNPDDSKLLKGTTPPRYENATLIPTNAGRFRRSGRALRQLLREGFFSSLYLNTHPRSRVPFILWASGREATQEAHIVHDYCCPLHLITVDGAFISPCRIP